MLQDSSSSEFTREPDTGLFLDLDGIVLSWGEALILREALSIAVARLKEKPKSVVHLSSFQGGFLVSWQDGNEWIERPVTSASSTGTTSPSPTSDELSRALSLRQAYLGPSYPMPSDTPAPVGCSGKANLVGK